MEDYGPQQEPVKHLMVMIDGLDRTKAHRIAEDFKSAGFPLPFYSTIVAAREGRTEQVRNARRDASVSVQLRAILLDLDPVETDYVARAASNAATAVATEDLIGCMSYGMNEYGRLVEPWFTGYGIEREGVA